MATVGGEGWGDKDTIKSHEAVCDCEFFFLYLKLNVVLHLNRLIKRSTYIKVAPEFAVGLVLKWQCHKIFCFRFFSWINFLQAPKNNVMVISSFSKKFSEIFASQGAPPVYQRHLWQMEQYRTADNLKWTWRKKFIYMITLLPKEIQRWVSTLANRSTARHRSNIRAPHAPSPQMYKSKVWESVTFLIEDFFYLPPVSTTPVMHLELQIYFRKN